jgi:hypothetical protein
VENGYENTNFLGLLTETDLKRLGIKKVAHRRNLLRKVQDIPDFKIPINVPVCIMMYFLYSLLKIVCLENRTRIFFYDVLMLSAKE